MPSKEQWGYWKDHPCTIAMMKELREIREEGIVEASFGAGDDSLLLLGTKLGKVNAITAVLNYVFIPEED